MAIVALGMSCCTYASAGDELYPADLSKWISSEPPREKSPNYSRKDWNVFLRDGRPRVRAHNSADDDRAKLPFAIEHAKASPEMAGQLHAAKVEDGWIVGFNAGEFGGGLWWFSPDGRHRSRISKEQVCGFVRSAKGLLALEGLLHLSFDTGHVIRITRGGNGRWGSEQLVDLGQAPSAATRVDDGSLIVVTTDRLLRVRPDMHVDTLLEKAFWSGLYPNSVIVDRSGAIYIGMRQGVTKIAATDGRRTVTWLRPSNRP